MKKIQILSLCMLLLVSVASFGQAKKTKAAATPSKDGKVEMYYFHYTARCITCRTLEAEAQKDAQTLYPELYKSGKITFQSLNLDDKSTEPLAKKLKVSGQTLLLVKGGKQINLTNEGFLYCRSDAEKFKSIIKEKLDVLLKK